MNTTQEKAFFHLTGKHDFGKSRTTKIAFILQMMSGPQLNENSPGSLKLRSGVTAYFVVE